MIKQGGLVRILCGYAAQWLAISAEFLVTKFVRMVCINVVEYGEAIFLVNEGDPYILSYSSSSVHLNEYSAKWRRHLEEI